MFLTTPLGGGGTPCKCFPSTAATSSHQDLGVLDCPTPGTARAETAFRVQQEANTVFSLARHRRHRLAEMAQDEKSAEEAVRAEQPMPIVRAMPGILAPPEQDCLRARRLAHFLFLLLSAFCTCLPACAQLRKKFGKLPDQKALMKRRMLGEPGGGKKCARSSSHPLRRCYREHTRAVDCPPALALSVCARPDYPACSASPSSTGILTLQIGPRRSSSIKPTRRRLPRMRQQQQTHQAQPRRRQPTPPPTPRSHRPSIDRCDLREAALRQDGDGLVHCHAANYVVFHVTERW